MSYIESNRNFNFSFTRLWITELLVSGPMKLQLHFVNQDMRTSGFTHEERKHCAE